MWRVVISGSHQRLWQLSLVAAAGPQCLPLARSQCSSMNSRSEKTCNLTPSSPFTHLIFNPRLTLSLATSHTTSGPQLWSLINAFTQLSNGTAASLTMRVFKLFSHIFCNSLYTSFILSNRVCLTLSVVKLGLVCSIRDCHPFKGLFLRWKSMSESRWIFWLWGKGNSGLFHPSIPLRHTQNLTHRSLDTRGKDEYKLSHVKNNKTLWLEWNILTEAQTAWLQLSLSMFKRCSKSFTFSLSTTYCVLSRVYLHCRHTLPSQRTPSSHFFSCGVCILLQKVFAFYSALQILMHPSYGTCERIWKKQPVVFHRSAERNNFDWELVWRVGEDTCEYSSSRSEFTGSIEKCRMLFLFTSNCAVYRDNRITFSIDSFLTWSEPLCLKTIH